MTTQGTKFSHHPIFWTILAFFALVSWILFFKVKTQMSVALPNVRKLAKEYPVIHYVGKNSKTPATQDFEIKFQTKRPPNWADYAEISDHLKNAVIVSEDSTFFSHEGFDPVELKEALKEDLEDRKFSRGASTITMQVVKNTLLNQEKSLLRKGLEIILAVEVDQKLSKRRILEVYLNIVELGQGIFGGKSASRHYFDKSVGLLSPKEAAFLAMLLPSPKRYSQSFRQKRLTRYASRTVQSILRKMYLSRHLTEEQFENAKRERLSFETTADTILDDVETDAEE